MACANDVALNDGAAMIASIVRVQVRFLEFMGGGDYSPGAVRGASYKAAALQRTATLTASQEKAAAERAHRRSEFTS